MDILWSALALMPLGIALRFALALQYGARGPAPGDRAFAALRILSWALLLLPLLAVTLMMNWLGALIAYTVAQAAFSAVLVKRERNRRAAWQLATRSDFLKTAGLDEYRLIEGRFSGRVGQAFCSFLRDLRAGAPWAQAVGKNYLAFPQLAPALAQLSLQNPPSMSRLEVDGWEKETSEDDGLVAETWEQCFERTSYLGLLVVAATVLATFYAIKILPSIESILDDYSIATPSTTRSLMTALWSIGPGILILTAIGGVLATIVAFLALANERFLRFLSYLAWSSIQIPRVLHLASFAMQQGRPLPEALDQIANGKTPFPPRNVRKRLVAATSAMNAGYAWPDALERAGLVSPNERAALTAATGAGNAPWALRLLARRRLRSMVMRRQLVTQLFFVGALLAISLFVAWYAVSLLHPLSQIIEQLSHA